MMLRAIGCNFHKTPVEVREKLAFPDPQVPGALEELSSRYGCEAVILNTCNRVEIYLARLNAPATIEKDLIAEFLAEWHKVSLEWVQPHLFQYAEQDAINHLFRVVGSLDSMIVGETQIAGQVKTAYELAQLHATAGPVMHALFQHARVVARRVQTETGITQGHVSVSSAAVDYVRQVFSHFDDKTILVIGAGKMGELTLRHLQGLNPKQIWVINRSFEKAEAVAKGCGGKSIPWNDLDDALARSDIILSTTGAPELIITRERWKQVVARHSSGTVVILDIAVPRDFDPEIHDGDRTCLFNIDDLKRIREQTLQDRRKHVVPAENIVDQETHNFLKKWKVRRHAPLIAQLTQELETRRLDRVKKLFGRLDGRMTDKDRSLVEGEFRLQQNEFLHVFISALHQESHEGGGTLMEAIRRLFRLE